MAQERAFTDAQQPPPGGVATAKGETTEIELSRAQQAIARRAAESMATIPHLVLEAEIDMHECAALSVHHEPRPTYEDMVLKACALTLREQPRVNSSYRDGRLQLHARVNVGVALWVEPGSPGGAAGESAPVTPTVFDADRKPLAQIARETRMLDERARASSIAPPELGGATFTITSLGAFPVTSFTAIINPPQTAILAVGAVELRPVAHAGAIVARHTMTATLACDSRALNGADAAAFLARVEQLLGEPTTLVR